MTSISKRIFTFANIVAVLALTISLSGGVYAATKIKGKDIKKGSVAGNRLKNDTLTGKQVKEATLKGFVSAADTRRFRFEQTSAGVTAQVLSLGTLRLSLRCEDNSGGYVSLSASSTAPPGARYDVNFIADEGSGSAYADVSGDLLGSSPAPLIFSNVGGAYERFVGTLVYNSDAARETINVTFALYVAPAAGGLHCNLAGTATRVRS